MERTCQVEVALLHCNLVNNYHCQESKVLFTFVPNKQFGQLITIAPYSLTMLNTANTEFFFFLLKYGLLIKIASTLKQKIMFVRH